MVDRPHLCGMTKGVGLPVGRTGGGINGGNIVSASSAAQLNPLKNGELTMSEWGEVSRGGREAGLGSRSEYMSLRPTTLLSCSVTLKGREKPLDDDSAMAARILELPVCGCVGGIGVW